MPTIGKKFMIISALMAVILALNGNTDTTLTLSLCYPDANSQMNNAILANLAPSLPKEGNKSCLKYKIVLSYEISQTVVKVYYKNARVDHTVQFQNFSLRDLMFPVNTTFEIEFFSGSTLIDSKEVAVQVEQSGLFFTYTIPSGKSVSRVKAKISKIELGQAMLERIVARQQLIGEYYTADVQIKLAEQELKKVDPNKIENNEQYNDITRKVLATVERIKAKKFNEKLFLNESDPVKLAPRLNALYDQAIVSKNRLASQTANMGKEYYRLGIVSLEKKDSVNAIQLFNKAIEVEPKMAMPYVTLAAIEANRRNFSKTFELIQFVDKNTTCNDSTKAASKSIIFSILNEMVEDARLSRQQNNFSDALIQIDSCYKICESISFLECPGTVDIERNSIYTSLLEQFINQNTKILQSKNYSEFIIKTDSLYHYQEQNASFFTNRALVFEHLNQSYQLLIKTAEENFSGNPTESLDALMASKRICETYNEVSCNPRVNDLISSVFGNLYESMVDEAMLLFNAQELGGADSLQQKAYEYCQQQKLSISEKHLKLIKLLQENKYIKIIDAVEALHYRGCQSLYMIDSAMRLRSVYNFAPRDNEAKVQKWAAEQCIAQSISDAEKSLIAKNFDQVTTFLNKAENLAKTHQIEFDQPTGARIAEIKGLLEQGICSEIKFSIDVQLNSAEIHLRNYEYPFASEALKKAASIVRKNANCGFTTDDIEDKIKYYQKPVEFQLEWEKVIDDIQLHRFELAATKILELEQRFSDSVLSPYNLQIKTIITFTKEYDYTPFTLGAIEYLAEHGKTEMALDLLYFLYEKEVPEHLTDNAQDKMGRSLAKRDVAKQKDGNPKDIAYQYIRHDEKWFKKMLKSYKSQWKKSIAS